MSVRSRRRRRFGRRGSEPWSAPGRTRRTRNLAGPWSRARRQECGRGLPGAPTAIPFGMRHAMPCHFAPRDLDGPFVEGSEQRDQREKASSSLSSSGRLSHKDTEVLPLRVDQSISLVRRVESNSPNAGLAARSKMPNGQGRIWRLRVSSMARGLIRLTSDRPHRFEEAALVQLGPNGRPLNPL